MATIEVEQRGYLPETDYFRVDKLLAQQGEFLGEKKRFSIISSNHKKYIKEDIDEKIDLRVRITNGRSELVLKYGKWGSTDSRREINIAFDTNDFTEMVDFMRFIGFSKIVLQATITRCYKYNGVEYALVQVPGWGYYFEAEIITHESGAEQAHKIIGQEIGKLKLKIANQEEYHELLDSLNNREGFRIDLNKSDFKDIKKRFSDYFPNE